MPNKDVIVPRPKKFLIALEKIKDNFSVVSSIYVEHFTGLNGYIEKVIINFQQKKLALFIVETNNDLQLRLFDTDQPEEYFVGKYWAPGNSTRTNNPFILNWKCLYKDPGSNSWLDIQFPLHKIDTKTEEVAFKLRATIKAIEIELFKIKKLADEEADKLLLKGKG